MNFIERQSSGAPRLRFIESPGPGVPLLFLHGVTRRSEDFHPLWPLLGPGRILALDQRGHGNSAHAASYLVTDYVNDAIALVREDIREPLFIYGHSLGAMVAVAVAAALGDQVRGVILEDPPFHTMGRNIKGTAWQAQFIGMQAVARLGGDIDAMTDALADVSVPQSDGPPKRLGALRDRASLRWSAVCLSRIDPQVLTPVIEACWLDGYDLPEIASRLRCPTILLQADPSAGGALMDADVALFENAVQSLEVIRFPGLGHGLHWLAPEKIAGVVRKRIESHYSSRSG